MTTLRFLTAVESHGPGLTVIIEGLPAGLRLSAEDIQGELARRRGGYGRGGRMKLETDALEVMGGLRGGVTLGTPVSLIIRNAEWESWEQAMHPWEAPNGPRSAPVTRPRPGHADLAGAAKYDHRDVRNVLERASARETAARVAAGVIAKKFLRELGIGVGAHVLGIGRATTNGALPHASASELGQFFEEVESSPVRTGNQVAEKWMMAEIDAAAACGDTLGGVFAVVAWGLPAGLGSHVQWDRKLDARLAGAMMSIPGVKGVELGDGFAVAGMRGSQAHDEILPGGAEGGTAGGPTAGPFGTVRATNHCGGLEGGITTGQPLLVRAAMKPIATLSKPLLSVDLATGKPENAAVERHDTCAVPAAAVVGESMVALELARAVLETYGGDTVADIRQRLGAARERMAAPWTGSAAEAAATKADR